MRLMVTIIVNQMVKYHGKLVQATGANMLDGISMEIILLEPVSTIMTVEVQETGEEDIN